MKSSRDARSLYNRGMEALARDNFDYAIALLNQALETEPGFFDCRKALRDAQFRKAGDGGKGFFKKMMSGAGNSPQDRQGQDGVEQKSRRGDGDCRADFERRPEQLRRPPHHRGRRQRAGTAAHRGAVLRNAREKFAQGQGRWPSNSPTPSPPSAKAPRAEKILMDLMREMPGDGELRDALKDLSARKTMDEGGYGALEGGGGSFRDILKDKKEAVSLEQEKRVQKSEDVTERLIGEYEARLQTEPDNFKLIRSLAELYTQKKQFDRALELYERVKQSDMGNDPSLDQSIAATIVKRFDSQLEQLNPFEPEHAAQVEKIKAEKLAFQVAECQKRVEKYPTDLAIRYEMGVLYFQTRQNRRGHPGIPEGAGQPLQAPRRHELPRPMLRQTQDVRPRRAHPPERHQGKARRSTTRRRTSSTTSAACSKAWAKRRRPSSSSNRFTRWTPATRTSPPRWTPFIRGSNCESFRQPSAPRNL